jgi:hypothetical protein
MVNVSYSSSAGLKKGQQFKTTSNLSKHWHHAKKNSAPWLPVKKNERLLKIGEMGQRLDDESRLKKAAKRKEKDWCVFVF